MRKVTVSLQYISAMCVSSVRFLEDLENSRIACSEIKFEIYVTYFISIHNQIFQIA